MILNKWLRSGLIWALFCYGCAGGGVSPDYYTLQSVNGIQSIADDQSESQQVIGLGPVSVPQYLDRSAIVTRVSPNRLTVNDGHRWAGSLKSEIMRVLADNIGHRIRTGEVILFPWSALIKPDSRFRVEIRTFEGRLGESVTLKAIWSVAFAPSDQPAVRRVSVIQEKVNGNDFEELAAAMGRALAGLSDEMAGAVLEVAITD
jgi:uncharacterized protein